MERPQKKQRRSVRGFLILLGIVIVSGALLWSQGDLRSPLQSTLMLIGVSSGEPGFAMAGERGPRSAETTTQTNTTDTSASASDTASTSPASSVQSAPAADASTGTMTLETLKAELAAAGVDVQAVEASMTAEGRSLDNLLAVVNSGRVTVADLATRLKGESNNQAVSETEGGQGGEGSMSQISIQWSEIGSVAYNLWMMLAMTVVVIILGRPVGWLVNQIKQPKRKATPKPATP